MKKIKVSVKDETTLRLEEKGEVGDLIDLKDLQSVDNQNLVEAIKNGKDQAYQSQLNEVLKHQETLKRLALNELEQKLNKEQQLTKLENEKLQNKIESLNASIEEKIKIASLEIEKQKQDELLASKETINALKTQLEQIKKDQIISENSLKKSYEIQLSLKDEQIKQIKDFKAKESTKMVGESLEKYCEYLFNSERANAYPRAYFEKDNDIRSGSKGDYIFRDFDEEGTEFISIMFEMKNETDTTSTKHKNEDFFKELDKDRHEKKCEYAVLVSLLENDNELYNRGIVDVSYRYPKMYVIRPQFFMSVISFLRNASKNTALYKKEIAVIKNQSLDVTNFEQKLNDFKDKFSYNYRLASEKFKTAIEEIDKTIDHLIKTKNNLLSSENNLRIANEKADDLTIKKLTKNNETMTKAFADIEEDK